MTDPVGDGVSWAGEPTGQGTWPPSSSLTAMTAISREAMLPYQGTPQDLVAALFPLPEHHVIYVRVPKAACSTLKLWIYRIHVGDPAAMPESIHRSLDVPRPHKIGWDLVARMLSGDAYRFTFVRNPVDRLKSAYWDKIVRPQQNSQWRDEVRAALGVGDDVEVTADLFLAAMEATDPVMWNVHWRPQHLLTMHGLVEYDHVGRLETFDTDVATIREAAELPAMPIEVRNRKGRPEDPLGGRPDLVRRVEALYAADFEAFGY